MLSNWIASHRKQVISRACALESLEDRKLFAVYTVPNTIAYDGSAEVTQAINDFIATVPDGTASSPNTIEFQDDGIYWIDGTIGVAGRSHLIIDGEGAKFEARDAIDPVTDPDLARRRSQWGFSNSKFITLTDMEIVGADPNAGSQYDSDREAQHCIAIFGGNNDIMVDGVTAGYCYGDAFYASADSYNLTLQNSHLEHMNRQGIGIVDNRNVMIRNNYIGDAVRTLIDLEPLTASMEVDHIYIIGNTTGPAGNAWLQMAAGNGWVGSAFIADNTINGAHGLSIVEDRSTNGRRRGPVVLLNNTATIVKEMLFKGENVDGVIALGNDVNSAIGKAVSVSTGDGAIVGNNRGVIPFVDTGNTDGWIFDNLPLGDPSFTRNATFTELPDGFGITATNVNFNGITNGTIKAFMRRTTGSSQLTWDGLTMTGDLAVAFLDANGDFVDGWTRDNTASYQGIELPVTGAAPVVLTLPAATTVVTGQTATFVAYADGPDLGYQWFKNGTLIADATGASYTTPVTTGGDNGALYTVVISNRYGSTTSAAGVLTVQAAAAPTITKQPISKTVNADHTTTFSIEATGSGTLSYQWKKNGVNITGATASIYVLPPALVADNGASITCDVTNATGTTTSSAATLNVVSVNITETWTGTNGAAWPAQWTTSGSGVTFTINTNRGRAQHTSGSGSQIGIAVINSVNLTDSDQTTGFRLDTHGGFGLVARRADAASSTFYYTQQTVTGSSNRLYLYKSVAGVATSLGYVVVSNVAAATDYKLRMVTVQETDTTTSIKLKMWPAANAEPSTWAMDVLDATPELQNVAGRSGVRFLTESGRVAFADDYSLDTDIPTSPAGVVTATDSFTAADGSVWPAQWTTTGANIQFTIQSNMARAWNTPSSGSEQVGYGVLNTTNTIDSDQTSSFRFNDNLGGFGLFARRADANTGTYYYTKQTVSGSANRLYVYKSVGGVSTSLGYATVSTALEDQLYKVRLVCEQNDGATILKVKMWDAATAEPTSWAMTVTDTTPELQNVSGRSGVRPVVQSGRSVSIDDYSFDTDLSGVTPLPPSGLAAKLVSANHTRLSWVDNSTHEFGYVVQRSLDNSTWNDLVWLAPGTTTYTDTGLAANTKYYYRVKAYNGEGFSADTSAIRATTPDNRGVVSETWTGANGESWATKWTFEGDLAQTSARNLNSNRGQVTTIASGTGTVLAYNNVAKTEDVDQTTLFNISASGGGVGLIARRTDADVNTYYYGYVRAGTATAYIYKVVDGTATLIASQAITAPSASTDYKLRFSVVTNGSATDLKLKVWLASGAEPGTWNVSTSDSTAALQGLSGRFGLFYYLNSSTSVYTDGYAATYTTTPSSPLTLTGTAVSPTQIDLSWTDSSNSETGYIIERTNDARQTTGWTAIGSVSAGATSYSDTTVTNATRYWYRVVAKNSGGRSAYAPIASVTSQDLPGEVKESFYGPDYETWGPKWTLSGALSTALSIGLANSEMKMTAKNSGGTGTIYSHVNTVNTIDANLTATFRLSANQAGFGLMARRADADSDTFYFADVVHEGATTRVRIYKSVDGTVSTLATSAAFNYTGTAMQLRFVVTTSGGSTTLQARVWDVTGSEPGTWNASVTDSTARLQAISGRMGAVIKMMTNGRTIYIDDFLATY